MDNDHFSTSLAYTKSPKTSKRTTFQNELEAAVSARASRHKPNYSYSDDFDDEDEDDMLSKLLKKQKEKKDRFKAGRTKGKINDFRLSDDEDENAKPPKVSFLKTKRNSSPIHVEQLDSIRSVDSHRGSFHSTQNSSTPENHWNSVSAENNQQSEPESTLQNADQSESVMRMRNKTVSSVVRKSLSESPLPLNSENSQWESSVPLPSEDQWDSPGSLLSEKEDNQRISFGEDAERPIPHPRERSVKPVLPTDCLAQDIVSPRPMPRQKTHAQAEVNMWDSGQLEEKTQAETPVCSGVATSSMSIMLSTEKSQISTDDSVQGPGEGWEKMQKHSSLTAEHLSEVPASAECVDLEGKQSASFEEKHKDSQCNLNHTFTTQAASKSTERKFKSSYKAESKYLGSLKILDQRLQDTQQIPEAANSLRAAVYQEWLKKKEENIKTKIRAKKQEEKLNEEKRQEEKFTKIADAKASYEAWKEKKVDVIRKKVKERQETINLQQIEMDRKKEKNESAKQVFEKWKQEHDEILKERMRKKKQTEKREKLQQNREKEERKRDCTSVFTEWSQRKKEIIQEKVKEECNENKMKELEEKYEKEEKEKMALEMYDKWLRRKEFQQKRERKEKRIQAILQDEPPPPWSPPNKTIPFGK